MNLKKTFVTIFIFIFFAIVLVAFAKHIKSNPLLVKKENPTEKNLACTKDLKMCPDGTAVGRIAPSCEFAKCSVGFSDSSDTYYLGSGNSVAILDIIEDSRCPAGATCVWEGTVKVRAVVLIDEKSKEMIMNLGTSYSFNNKTITMTQAGPKDNYDFKFNIK